MLLLTLAPAGTASEDPMPKTLTVASFTIQNVPGGAYRVRVLLLDSANAVVAEATSADVVVPADPQLPPSIDAPVVEVV